MEIADFIEIVKSKECLNNQILADVNIKELIIKLEKSNIDLDDWQRICVYLYNQKMTLQFMELIDYLIIFKIKEKKYEHEKYNTSKIKIINSLSVYYLQQAIIEVDLGKREELFDKMKIYVNLSDKISIGESLTFGLKGI